MSKIYKHSLQDDIGYWLSRLRMKVHSSFEAKILAKDVTIPQWCILISVYNGDAVSIGELAKFIDIDKGSISRVVEKLVKMKLIIHEQGKDRRSGNIKLTEAGKKITPELAKLAELNEEEFFSSLSIVEKKQLKQILKKLLKNAGIHSTGGWLAE